MKVLLMILAIVFASMTTFAATDIASGEKRAAVCFACHGKNGISKIPGTPHLAGQEHTYLEKALQAYRLGQTRQDPTMTQMAKPLSDQDISNIAAYFSTLKPVRKLQVQTLETKTRTSAIDKVGVERSVEAVTADQATKTKSGKDIYQASCSACHASGVMSAPKIGDKAAWAARVQQGNDILYQHALSGIKMMPPKGGCSACSDEEVRLAVDFLLGEVK